MELKLYRTLSATWLFFKNGTKHIREQGVDFESFPIAILTMTVSLTVSLLNLLLILPTRKEVGHVCC